MTEAEIEKQIEGYINGALDGMEKESPKVDFKAKWYDLKHEEDINEFLKDSTSIANTPGLDGYIIIGFSDKKKEFTDSFFHDCNLKDSNELNGILIRRVDRSFNLACYDIKINNHNISVIHIPPSFDKPHVIRNYKKGVREEQHRVFIRNGTSTRIANKYDLDFIAYDRKNNIPEYSLYMSMPESSLILNIDANRYIEAAAGIIIENNGYRPVAISEIKLELLSQNRELNFISRFNKEDRYNTIIKSSNLIVQQNELRKYVGLTFISEQKFTDAEFKSIQASKSRITTAVASVSLNTGRTLRIQLYLT